MIYFIQHPKTTNVKIGWSDNPARRIVELKQIHRTALVVLGVMDGDRAFEQGLHRLFAGYNVKDEWFTPHRTILEYIGANTHLNIPKNQLYKYQVTVPDELYRAIHEESDETGVPINRIAIRALKEYYQRRKVSESPTA